MRHPLALSVPLLIAAVSPPLAAQSNPTVAFSVDSIQVPLALMTTTKCVQVGLRFTVSNVGDDNDWSSIAANLNYTDTNDILAGDPVLQKSAFLGTNETPEPGLTSPGTPLDGSSTSLCQPDDIINAVTLSQAAATNFIANATNPSSTGTSGGFEDVTTASKLVQISAQASDLFRTANDTAYLYAILSFPIKAGVTTTDSIEITYENGQSVVIARNPGSPDQVFDSTEASGTITFTNDPPPPPPSPEPIPTLSQWAMIFLAGLLALLAYAVPRRSV
jgi:hypothetical protein